MARRRSAVKREVIPDPVFGSDVVAKFINCVMRHGKKSVAERIVYGAIDEISKRSKSRSHKKEKDESGEGGEHAGTSGKGAASSTAGLDIFFKAIENVSPTVEVRARRVGGSTYQIPVEVRASRRMALAMRWLIEAASSRSGEKSMDARLAHEIMDAAEGRGNAYKKREDVHRMAKSNQAFAHFRLS